MRRIERPDPAEPETDWPLRRLRRLVGLLVVAMFLVAVCSSVAEASVIETSSGTLVSRHEFRTDVVASSRARGVFRKMRVKANPMPQ